MNRRTFIKFFCFGGAIAICQPRIYQLLLSKAEAAIPWMSLINALVLGVELINNTFSLGEKIFGKTKLQNQTDKKQEGYIRIQTFSVRDPVEPDMTIDHKVTVSPRAIETYDLPPLIVSTAGHRVLQVRTAINSSSTEFRYGSFCCDSKGVRRCPIPYTIPINEECYCSGQGAGIICE